MNSTKIRVKNIPPTDQKIKSIHLKPRGKLIVLLSLGIVLLFFGRPAMIFGIWLIIISLFGLVLMPDRLLVSWCDDFLILHDRRDQSVCWLIYWTEILNWQYEKHSSYDQFFVNMTDGSVHGADAYSHRSVARVMNRYLPGKEIKSASGRSKK